MKLGVNKAKWAGEKFIVFERYLERIFVRSQWSVGGGVGIKKKEGCSYEFGLILKTFWKWTCKTIPGPFQNCFLPMLCDL